MLAMNILIVSQYFWPENFRINDLAKGLIERGHQVDVLTGLPNYPAGEFSAGYGWSGPYRQQWEGVTIIRVPLFPRGKKKGLRLVLNYFSFAFFASVLGPLFCRKKYEAIFVYQVSPVTVGIPALFMKLFRGGEIFFWICDLWPDTLLATKVIKKGLVFKIIDCLVSFILKRCRYVLLSTPGFKARVCEQGVLEKKVIVWPQWAEDFYLRREFKESELRRNLFPKGFNILFAGNLGTSQGLETVIAACQKLRHIDDLNWIILGDGLMREWLENESKRLNLQLNFRLLPPCPAEEVPAYYHLADCLLLTLRKDPLFALTIPGKVASCLASGKPIVAALEGEPARVVAESQAGLICEPENADALASVVSQMYHLASEVRTQMGQNGEDYFRRTFKRSLLFDKLEGLLKFTTTHT